MSMTVNEKWVKGVRAWWKQWVKGVEKYPGKPAAAAHVDMDLLADASKATRAYLDKGRARLERLWTDLETNKSFWYDRESFQSILTKEYRAAAEKLVIEARKSFHETDQDLEFWGHGGHYALEGRIPRLEEFNFTLLGIHHRLAEGVKAVDKIVSGRLLRLLTKLANDEWDRDSISMHEPAVPDDFSIGGVKVLLRDRDRGRIRDPHKIINPTVKQRGESGEARRDSIKSLHKAHQLLRKHGFGHLWYGRIEVYAHNTAPNSPITVGKVEAHYFRSGDFVRVYGVGNTAARLIIHELGHRYWFKFMSAQDRANFSKWFGEVPASSSYGAINTSEDFAEVFADYVVSGHKLNSAQRNRLRTFFGRKRRQESNTPKKEKHMAVFTESTRLWLQSFADATDSTSFLRNVLAEGDSDEAFAVLDKAMKSTKKGRGRWIPPHNVMVNETLLGGINLWVFSYKARYRTAVRDKPEGLVISPKWESVDDGHSAGIKDSGGFYTQTKEHAEIILKMVKRMPSIEKTTREELDAVEAKYHVKIPASIKTKLIRDAVKVANRRWGAKTIGIKKQLIPFDGSKPMYLGSWEY